MRLSEESQKTVATDALGVSVREDVRSAAGESTDKNTPSGVLQGVNVWTPNWNDVLSSLDADIAAYQKATGS